VRRSNPRTCPSIEASNTCEAVRASGAWFASLNVPTRSVCHRSAPVSPANAAMLARSPSST
jgi:hypothetical protein